MIANMLKSLVEHERIETTVTKAKELRRHADRLVTLAKEGSLAARRRAIAKMMIRFNPLTSKEARELKKDPSNTEIPNGDRRVVGKLFSDLASRFASRQGGYTRIVRTGRRIGDNAPTCVIEYLSE